MIIKLANNQVVDTTTKTLYKAVEMQTKAKGFILYEGASVLDGSNIVVIATLSTSNKKTGDMIQVWILNADDTPLNTVKNKKDGGICGNCPQRRNIGGSCYVTLHQAPRSIYDAYTRGIYPKLTDANIHFLMGRSIRLGAYGDPAAVPFEVLEKVASVSGMMTGYTHQLAHKNFDNRITKFCMVSTETEKSTQKAQSLGFRTFRVKTEKMPLLENEIYCMSDSHNMSCKDCGLCGNHDQNKVNIAINVHGALQTRFTGSKNNLIATDK